MGVVGALCLLIALVLCLRGRVALHDNHLSLQPRPGKPRIAVLIPARDESAVIEGLLKSLARQTVKLRPEDIYVIVEQASDSTVEICQKYHNTVLLRQDLSKQRKGYALDEAVKMIRKQEKHYDLYFVFDADNILEKDYLAEMLKSYAVGYEIATGYRNAKNCNANAIAAVSSLTFSMINVMSNHRRARYGANIVFSGTGFFVTGELVDEWQGWPFFSLTEDYEMSLYATLHGIATTYNEDAMFYDEQPTKYRQTVAQRVRWIKGFFTARKKYIPLMRLKRHAQNPGSLRKEIIGVKPAIFAIIGAILVLLSLLVGMLSHGKVVLAVQSVLIGLLLIYLILLVITIVMIRREKMAFTPKIKLQAALLNPLYLVTYIPCALKALLKKDVTWQKIEHNGK